jgi:isopentenyl diphosphate isomerase/L-lactate dehydrogenase-like FMN-dependent dehydrogenase
VSSEPKPINVADYERLAEAACEPGYWGYVVGGAGDESTLRDNLEAFRRLILRPRMLVDVSDVSTATTALGTEIELPVLIAPTSLQRVAHPDGEPALARAAAAAGTIYTLSSLGSVRPRELAEAAGDGPPRWFQLYWSKDRGFTGELVAEAADAGFTAIVLTVDLPTAGPRERDLRSGFSLPPDLPMPNLPRTLVGDEYFHDTLGEIVDTSLTWRDLEWLRGLSELPLVVKGVLTAEDALLACEHGCAGIVVSNHGGRQLDGVAATLDALPEVVEAAGGAAEVYLDGGVRRGTDVVKALALGARAVLIGRPALYGLAAGGEEGAHHVLELLRAEVRLALLLLGCTAPADVGPQHVRARA